MFMVRMYAIALFENQVLYEASLKNPDVIPHIQYKTQNPEKNFFQKFSEFINFY